MTEIANPYVESLLTLASVSEPKVPLAEPKVHFDEPVLVGGFLGKDEQDMLLPADMLDITNSQYGFNLIDVDIDGKKVAIVSDVYNVELFGKILVGDVIMLVAEDSRFFFSTRNSSPTIPLDRNTVFQTIRSILNDKTNSKVMVRVKHMYLVKKETRELNVPKSELYDETKQTNTFEYDTSNQVISSSNSKNELKYHDEITNMPASIVFSQEENIDLTVKRDTIIDNTTGQVYPDIVDNIKQTFFKPASTEESLNVPVSIDQNGIIKIRAFELQDVDVSGIQVAVVNMRYNQYEKSVFLGDVIMQVNGGMFSRLSSSPSIFPLSVSEINAKIKQIIGTKPTGINEPTVKFTIKHLFDPKYSYPENRDSTLEDPIKSFDKDGVAVLNTVNIANKISEFSNLSAKPQQDNIIRGTMQIAQTQPQTQQPQKVADNIIKGTMQIAQTQSTPQKVADNIIKGTMQIAQTQSSTQPQTQQPQKVADNVIKGTMQINENKPSENQSFTKSMSNWVPSSSSLPSFSLPSLSLPSFTTSQPQLNTESIDLTPVLQNVKPVDVGTVDIGFKMKDISVNGNNIAVITEVTKPELGLKVGDIIVSSAGKLGKSGLPMETKDIIHALYEQMNETKGGFRGGVKVGIDPGLQIEVVHTDFDPNNQDEDALQEQLRTLFPALRVKPQPEAEPGVISGTMRIEETDTGPTMSQRAWNATSNAASSVASSASNAASSVAEFGQNAAIRTGHVAYDTGLSAARSAYDYYDRTKQRANDAVEFMYNYGTSADYPSKNLKQLPPIPEPSQIESESIQFLQETFKKFNQLWQVQEFYVKGDNNIIEITDSEKYLRVYSETENI